METAIERFPYGAMEGCPALTLRVDRIPDQDELADVVRLEAQAGTTVVWVRDAPWGDTAWDRAILRMLADPQLEHMTVAAVRSVGAERWSNLRLHWIGDLTTMMLEPRTLEAVRDVLSRVTYHAPLAELLLVRPDLANVKPSILDEIYTTLDPSGAGYVYGPDDPAYQETALSALGRCAAPWAIRVDRARKDDDDDAGG